MKRLTLILATVSAVLAASHVLASDRKGQPPAAKHQIVVQMIACMKKRMNSDRLISYNQASKVCREQVRAQLEQAQLDKASRASAEPLVVDTDTRQAR